MPLTQKEIYRKYHASPKAKKDRAARNKARREAEKAGKVKKGDGKEVHHVKALASGGSRNGKTSVVSRKTNRQKGMAIANKRMGKTGKKS